MAKKKPWYLVSGRRDGDDKDTTHVFKAADGFAAEQIFIKLAAGGTDDEDEFRNPLYEIYINAIVRCGDTEPIIEYLHGD